MPLVRFTSFYNGVFTVYSSPTGLTDARTGMTEVGGDLYIGNVVDLSPTEAANLSQAGTSNIIYGGRYRFVQLSPLANPANTGYGKPVAWALGQTVARIAVVGGSGYTPGTYTLTSSTSGGSVAATAQIIVGPSGAITSGTVLNPGAGFTSVPAFTIPAAAGSGTGGSVLAQVTEAGTVVTTYDGSAAQLSTPRGIMLTSVTQAQITAGAYIVIQETGVSTVQVTAGSALQAGAAAAASTGGAVTITAAATSIPVGYLGDTLDVSAPGILTRIVLRVPFLT